MNELQNSEQGTMTDNATTVMAAEGVTQPAAVGVTDTVTDGGDDSDSTKMDVVVEADDQMDKTEHDSNPPVAEGVTCTTPTTVDTSKSAQEQTGEPTLEQTGVTPPPQPETQRGGDDTNEDSLRDGENGEMRIEDSGGGKDANTTASSAVKIQSGKCVRSVDM